MKNIKGWWEPSEQGAVFIIAPFQEAFGEEEDESHPLIGQWAEIPTVLAKELGFEIEVL